MSAKKIDKHYFYLLTQEIVSVENLLQWYLNDGDACKEKPFMEYLEDDLLENDLWPLDDAEKFTNWVAESIVDAWKKECKSMDIDPKSEKGSELWYDKFSERFMEYKGYERMIKEQMEMDAEKEKNAE